MWQNGKLGGINVYRQRENNVVYEIYHSGKLELIVRNADINSTYCLRFEGKKVKNINGYHNEADVEKIVSSIPNLDQLPEDIVRTLRTIRKEEIKVEPTQD